MALLKVGLFASSLYLINLLTQIPHRVDAVQPQVHNRLATLDIQHNAICLVALLLLWKNQANVVTWCYTPEVI